MVCKAVGFDGHLVFDTSKPDGTLRKILDFSRLQALGWKPAISLEQGLQSTYVDFLQRVAGQHEKQASTAKPT
jgi:GDP-L-fucose synthase